MHMLNLAANYSRKHVRQLYQEPRIEYVNCAVRNTERA
jgi:hypothetical protein